MDGLQRLLALQFERGRKASWRATIVCKAAFKAGVASGPPMIQAIGKLYKPLSGDRRCGNHRLC